MKCTAPKSPVLVILQIKAGFSPVISGCLFITVHNETRAYLLIQITFVALDVYTNLFDVGLLLLMKMCESGRGNCGCLPPVQLYYWLEYNCKQSWNQVYLFHL
jgi:hypothetical protein